MEKPLKGRLAFITGASSGIGKAIAYSLAEAGANLILSARRKEKLEALKQEIEEREGVEVLTLTIDLDQVEEIFQAIGSLTGSWAQVDILINNAGLALGTDPVHKGTWADWQSMINTNLMGLAAVTHALLPSLTKGRLADIINLGSIAGDFAYAGGAIYCATKSAVKTFSDGLRIDLVHLPIRISLIKPGMTQTDFSSVRFKGDEEKAEAVYASLEEPLQAEDVARIVLSVLSLPAHVSISELTVVPTEQANGMVKKVREKL